MIVCCDQIHETTCSTTPPQPSANLCQDFSKLKSAVRKCLLLVWLTVLFGCFFLCRCTWRGVIHTRLMGTKAWKSGPGSRTRLIYLLHATWLIQLILLSLQLCQQATYRNMTPPRIFDIDWRAIDISVCSNRYSFDDFSRTCFGGRVTDGKATWPYQLMLQRHHHAAPSYDLHFFLNRDRKFKVKWLSFSQLVHLSPNLWG